jgi:LAO/AO transport system kinase
MTDLNLLLMLAGAGDELQGIKRGIMESADLIAVTKADGDNTARARSARLDLQQAVQLLPAREHGGRPKVLAVSATTGEGIAALAKELDALHGSLRERGHVAKRRAEQGRWWLHQAIGEGLLELFRGDVRVGAAYPGLEDDVVAGRITPFRAAQRLIALFRTAS